MEQKGAGRILEIVPYDRSWSEAYSDGAKKIRDALKGMVIGIHHIGSSDADSYCQGKSSFIGGIDRKAGAWARSAVARNK